ncbi:MAG: hypothetical protein PHQ96_04880 [Candidatus Omnitrophica bacterium]|nr:hypothetical protein [Candidatus Omnitrophota bacterium]
MNILKIYRDVYEAICGLELLRNYLISFFANTLIKQKAASARIIPQDNTRNNHPPIVIDY